VFMQQVLTYQRHMNVWLIAPQAFGPLPPPCVPPCSLLNKGFHQVCMLAACLLFVNPIPFLVWPRHDAPFKVRGARYLQDSRKVEAGLPVFRLEGIELLETKGAVHHISRYLEVVRWVVGGVCRARGGEGGGMRCTTTAATWRWGKGKGGTGAASEWGLGNTARPYHAPSYAPSTSCRQVHQPPAAAHHPSPLCSIWSVLPSAPTPLLHTVPQAQPRETSPLLSTTSWFWAVLLTPTLLVFSAAIIPCHPPPP
jgi:hypothetical protein